MGRFRTGFLYADAELMKTYCPQCPVNSPMSRCDCRGREHSELADDVEVLTSHLRVCRIVLDVAGDEPNTFGQPSVVAAPVEYGDLVAESDRFMDAVEADLAGAADIQNPHGVGLRSQVAVSVAPTTCPARAHAPISR